MGWCRRRRTQRSTCASSRSREGADLDLDLQAWLEQRSSADDSRTDSDPKIASVRAH